MRSVVVGVSVVAIVGGVVTAAVPSSAAPSTQPSPAASGAAGTFFPVDAQRVLDTRKGLGGRTPGAGGTVHLQVAGGSGPSAASVSAVVLHVTAVAPATTGYVTAYADGGTRPKASNVNFARGRTVSNLVVAPVNPRTGKVALYNGSAGSTPLVADVSGYYRSGNPTLAGSFRSLTPARVLDTRTNLGGSTPQPHGTVEVQVTGRGNVPASGVSAVLLNVATVSRHGGGYLTVYGAGQARPDTSSLNFGPSQTVANLVVAPVGSGGKVAIYNGGAGGTGGIGGPTPLIADVAGYVRSGTATAPGTLHLLPPVRALDTRRALGATTPLAKMDVAVAVDGSTGVDGSAGAGPTGVPADNVNTVVMNLTALPSGYQVGEGFVQAWRAENDSTRPLASSLNFRGDQTAVSNLAYAPVNTRGDAWLYNGSTESVGLLGDIAGYFIGNDGSVSGTVTDARTHAPVANVQVLADGGESNFAGEAVTDSSGRYTISGLDPYSYQVCFYTDKVTDQPPTGYVSGTLKNNCLPDNVTVDAGRTTTGADLALVAGAAIGGTVTAPGAAPNSSVGSVDIYDSSGDSRDGATVKADGTYRVQGLAPGTYVVCFQPANRVGSTVTLLPQCYDGQPWGGPSDDPNAPADLPTGATRLTVASGDERTGIDATLQPDD